jgi:hypothetical protein
MLSTKAIFIRSLLEGWDGKVYTPNTDPVSYFKLNAAMREASAELLDPEKSKAGRELFQQMFRNKRTIDGRIIKTGRVFLTDQAANPKLEKSGIKFGNFHTKGLTLLPAKKSGRINMCPCATVECEAACLNMKGRGAMSQGARGYRANILLDQTKEFMHGLDGAIEHHATTATQAGKQPVMRLNVVSDLVWEQNAPHLFEKHKGVRFYDYTKIANRMLNPDKTLKKLPDNYHLTLSSTGIVGDSENWEDVQHVLRQGGSSAMVFRTLAGRGTPGRRNYRAPAQLPKYLKWTHEGVPHVAIIVDGDEHDLRFKDQEIAKQSGAYEQAQKDHPGAVIVKGIVAGLRLKGGKKDLEEAGEFPVDMGNGHTINVDAVKAAEKQNKTTVPLTIGGQKLKEIFLNYAREMFLRG